MMHNFIIYTVLVVMATLVLAVPIANNASTNSTLSGREPAFVSEPSGRGTMGLIWSCSATFIVCIWTSVHTDIPPLYASDLLRFKYKAVWMIVSAVIPEGLIMCSYGQWREARKVQEVWIKTFKDNESVKKERREITMEEAFFVVMGGFTVGEFEYIPVDSTNKTTPVYYTSTLTPHGFKTYIEEGRIDPHVFEKRHISDKGKGSNIAKAIACIQVLWLAIQCVSRKASHLPITLLEIHVVIQVACTIGTYALWWCKPLDVQQPILITLSDVGGGHTISEGSSANSTDTSSLVCGQEEKLLSSLPPGTLDAAKEQFMRGQQTQGCAGTAKPEELLFIIRRGPPDCLPTIAQACHDIVMYLDGEWSMMVIESLLTIPIGGFHALAWNSYFPTLLECWLWRICSLGMCSLPVCVVFISYWGSYQKILVAITLEMSFVYPGHFKDLPRFLVVVVRKTKEAGLGKGGHKHLLMICVCLLIISLYAVCVLFITAEAYISVRSLPEGSFKTPKWSDYLLHL